MKENKSAKRLPGFYIAICCCVIAIGVAGFLAEEETTQTNISTVTVETEQPVADNTNVEDNYVTDVAELELIPTQIPETPSMAEFEIDNPDIAPVSVTVNAEESCNFANPLADMTILYGYVTDNLVFNEVYGDWRTHNGIDIAAPLGCSVNAVAAGTVTDVLETSYGKTIKIEHTDGFVSSYSQLGEISVKVGDAIESGAVIGTIGESIGENIKEPHLHYELYKNGKCVNPQEY